MNQQELTPEFIRELKQYVFALHIGQNVYVNKAWPKLVDPLRIEHFEGISFTEGYLQLRSLQTITDAEAIEVAKIYGYTKPVKNGTVITCKSDWKTRIELVPYIEFIELGYDSYGESMDLSYPMPISVYQYLQQQGFARPIYYKGTLFSVKKLIELGIIKLKEATKDEKE